ncbi:aminotransferase [Rhodoferax sp. TH121]|uniref:aminotransferase class V-fold PLP-dependent enzyme n=1 Tax=Rhodoferax sp. TH121 TaxID=2022803 RepID=UPI000B9635AA|nr:aminotransferase class V-fold PLP-dependent enzyme [Rhodoferax sp. TH121]OYQ39239.1 aminotransferase [Rhodoferax sp. TH121]
MTENFDVQALRAETPGCSLSAFFNHSGASLPSARTTRAIATHLDREALHGGMEAAALVETELTETRRMAEALLGAQQNEVAYTSSASAAIGLAFAAMPPLQRGDRILVGRHEWGGNVSTYMHAANRAGATVEVIPCREDGTVDAEALARMVDERVRLVSLTWVPANGGLVNDAEAIGQVTSAAGVPYFIDAGQVLGQMPVDVERLRCDVLKGTCRKFLRGPRGTALLYVRNAFAETLRPVFLDVQSGPWGMDGPKVRRDARAFETIEGSVALIMGLREALLQVEAVGVDRIQARVKRLADSLRAQLSEVPGVLVRDLGTERCGLVSFTVEGADSAMIKRELAARHIVVGGNGVSYTPYDMTARGLTSIVRASVSYLNTEEELDALVRAVSTL